MRIILTALLMFAFAGQAAAEYKRISDGSWWKTANVFDVIDELASGVDVMEPASGGWYAIHAASLHGGFSAFKMVLEATTDFSVQTEWGLTALMLAAKSTKDGLKKVKALLKGGANVMARDYYGYTPLHFSVIGAEEYSGEIIQILLGSGADVMARANDGRTPLHFARKPGVAQVLLSNGAKTMARDGNGITPLHSAAISAATKQGIIEVLLEAGADPNAKDKYGKDPWYYMEFYGHLKGTKSYWALNDARFN